MKRRLFWKLLAVITLGTVSLFWLIDVIASHTEDSMSHIDQSYRAELRAYANQAESILKNQGEAALAQWVDQLEQKESTWIAIIQPSLNALANTSLSERYQSEFTLGRNVDWKIHLYFHENPTIDIPFADGITHFLIQLPQRMRPGSNLLYIDLLLQIALPCAILCFITYVLYRHIMRPLRKLEQATKAFSEGDFSVRADMNTVKKKDELTHLAATFDQMAQRISTLIVDQRQLLADLSHELRTPLARLNIAVDCVEQNVDQSQALGRLRYESANMQALIDDALTLAWFNTESPNLALEPLDIMALIQIIYEDAQFEYPEHRLQLEASHAGITILCAQQALAAALENTLRNALSHTPAHRTVTLRVRRNQTQVTISIDDQGPGVPEEFLEDIFKPFFRLPSEGGATQNCRAVSSQKSGYGLGLALAKRQIEAQGGTIYALNRYNARQQTQGLSLIITLPLFIGEFEANSVSPLN